jgi:Copper amine oxidase N-terminal domain
LYHFSKSARAVAAAAGAVALCTSIALAQADVSVTLNGAPLNLTPAPQERAGRVFVPLRGVFEQLGASVVYENGTINAQGRGNRSVSLHIGSTQATVDGQPQTMDVAPFIIGASTYVPLRFVSQALGASVNYDASNRIVALGSGGPGPQQGPPQGPPPRAMQPPPPQAPQRSALVLSAVQPGRDEAVAARRPTIEAQFATVQANPNSLRIELDGLNVTDQASRSPRGVVFSPPSDLQSGKHEVRIAGTDVNGMPFDARWSFASGTSTVSNSITDVRPGNGTSVRDQFTVSGRTMPGARVVVQVGTVDHPRTDTVLGQLFGGGSGSDIVRSEVTADGSGNFQTPISIPAHPGQGLTLVVDSTDAQTKSAAPRIVRNLTVE